jgi:CheY-like chemotaxis protein
VDDNATSRTFLKAQIAGHGMAADSAASAADALERLRDALAAGRPYAVAVIDMDMPDTSGLELAAVMAADPALAPVHRLLLTPLRQRVLDTTLSTDVQACVTKPVRPSHLLQCLARLAAVPNGLPQPAAMATQHARSHVTGPRLRVLVVEDNPVNQKVVTRMLEKRGHTADVASSGREAVEAIARTLYDLVLMDCQMPEMDGLEATRVVRRLPGPGHAVPIVALTANAMQGARERCLEAGMNDYIAKPFKPAALDAVLARWGQGAASPPRTGLTPPDGESAPPPIDRAVLAELQTLQDPNEPDFVGDLIAKFLGDVEPRLEGMREAVARADLAELGRLAHAVKGASASIGAQIMTTLSAKLEDQARSGIAADVAAILAGLMREYERARQALEAEQRMLTSGEGAQA